MARAGAGDGWKKGVDSRGSGVRLLWYTVCIFAVQRMQDPSRGQSWWLDAAERQVLLVR